MGARQPSKLPGASQLLVHGLVLCCATLSSAQNIGPVQQGFATFYGGPQDNTSPYVASFGLLSGSCGYGQLQQNEWPFWQATAIGPGNILYSSVNLKGCGACIQATCTTGCNADAKPLLVLVTDTCDDCTDTQINIHSLAFQQYFQSDLTVGRVGVTWQQADCNPPGNIVAKVVDSRSSDGGFIAVAPESVGGDGVIKNMEIMSSGQSTWSPMTNAYGIVWQGSNLGSTPFSLRITGSTGQMLVASGAITQFTNGEYPTSVQFTGFGGAVPPTTPTLVTLAPSVASTSTPAATPPYVANPPPILPAPSLASPPVAATPPPVAAPPPVLPPPRFAQPPPAATPVPAPPAPPPQNRTVPAPAPSRRPTPAPSSSNATAPAPAPSQRSSPTPAPGPSPQNATAPAPAPAQSPSIGAPAPAPAGNATGAQQAASAAAPGTTQLTLNSNLTGAAASAANAIANPAVNIAG